MNAALDTDPVYTQAHHVLDDLALHEAVLGTNAGRLELLVDAYNVLTDFAGRQPLAHRPSLTHMLSPAAAFDELSVLLTLLADRGTDPELQHRAQAARSLLTTAQGI